jgi:hypothetical protein
MPLLQIFNHSKDSCVWEIIASFGLEMNQAETQPRGLTEQASLTRPSLTGEFTIFTAWRIRS